MHFDHIVVGAGSGGAVVAARLSEAGETVLLLEAGPDFPLASTLPDRIRSGLAPHFPDKFDWTYSAAITATRRLPYPRGMVMGGSSAINAGLALRGAPEDYDEWADRGNEQWSWEKVRPYFLAIENDPLGGLHHGADGPIPIRRWNDIRPEQDAYYRAARSLGMPHNDDHNAPGNTGVAPGPANIVDAVRYSTAMAYLTPEARSRDTLTIWDEALVDRLERLPEDGWAVRITREGTTDVVTASNVILAAGAIGTPLILQRSGIGPASLLEAMGIPVLVDSPGVGQNLIEHAQVVMAFTPTSPQSPDLPFWQMILEFSAPDSGARNELQGLLWQSSALNLLRVMTGLMKPRSVGSVAITDRDPSAPPAIELDLGSDPYDVRTLIEGLKVSVEIMASEQMLSYHDSTAVFEDGTTLTLPEVRALLDSDEAADLVARTIRHYVHPIGTVRMGSDSDEWACADQRGRVRGAQGLWVADASLMPTIPRANTNLICVVIGERIAQWIIDEAGK